MTSVDVVLTKKLHNDMKTVTDFSHLEDKINTGKRFEVVARFRTRLRWEKL